MTLKNYFGYMKSQHDERPLYLFDDDVFDNHPDLLNDFEVFSPLSPLTTLVIFDSDTFLQRFRLTSKRTISTSLKYRKNDHLIG